MNETCFIDEFSMFLLSAFDFPNKRVTFVQMFYYFIKIPYRIAIKCSYNLKCTTKSQTNVKKKI